MRSARAWLSFLPALAPTVLGGDLALPNVATWWLGQARARDEIIDRLDEMVIASAFLGELPGHGERREVLGAMLEPEERTRILAQRPVGAAPVHAAAVPGADQRRMARDARRLRAGCG